MTILTPSQQKRLARDLNKLFPKKNPVSKKGNTIQIRGDGGIAVFPIRATPLTKERTIS